MNSEGDGHNDTTNTDYLGGGFSDLSQLNLSHIPVWSGERNPSTQKRIKELTDFKRKAKGQEVDWSFIVDKAARRGHSYSSSFVGTSPAALRSGVEKEESKKNATVTTKHTAGSDTSGQPNSTKYVLTDLYTMDEPSAYVRLRAVYETARAGGFSNEKPFKPEESMASGGAIPPLLINGNDYENKGKKEGNQSLAVTVRNGKQGNKVKIGDNYYDLDATPSSAHPQQQLTDHTSRSRPTFAKGSTSKPGQVVTSKLSSIPLEPLDRTVVTLHPSVRTENPLYYRLSAPMPGMVNDEPPMMHKKEVSDHHPTPAPAIDSNDKNSSSLKVVANAVAVGTSFGAEGSVGALNYVRIVRDVAARREALEREGVFASNAFSADDANEYVSFGASALSSTSTIKSAVRDKTQSQHNQRTTDEMFPSTDVCRNWRDGPIGKHVLSWEPQEFRDTNGGGALSGGSILRSVGPFDRKRTAGGLAKQEAVLEARSQADRKILLQQKRIERRLKGNNAERSKRGKKTKASGDEASAAATSDDERLISSSSSTSNSSSDDGVDPHLRSFLSPLEEAKLIAQAAKIGEENTGAVTTKHFHQPQQQHNVPPQIRSNDTNRLQSVGLVTLRTTSPSSRVLGTEDDQAIIQSLATMYSFAGDNDRVNQFKFKVETDEPPPSPTGQFIELLTEAVGVEEGLRDDFASRVAAEREKLIEENRLEAVKKLLLLRGKNADHIVTDQANHALSITNTLNTLSMTAAQDTAIATAEADRIKREKQRIEAEKNEEEQEKQRSTLRKLQQEAEAERDFYKKRRLSLLAAHQPPMDSFRPSCSVPPGRAVKCDHEHGDDENIKHYHRRRHQHEIDEGSENSTQSVHEKGKKGASPLSSPRTLLGVGNLKLGGGATPRSRNNPILACNNPESKRSSASPSPRNSDAQRLSNLTNVNNRNASPAKKNVSFFESNKSLAVADMSHSPPSPRSGHLSNGERFEWKGGAANNQRTSSQTVLTQNQSQSPTELLTLVSTPYVPPILITTASNNGSFPPKKNNNNNNNSFSFSSDQGMASSNVQNHRATNSAADGTAPAAARDEHANIKAGAERREMYKCAALSRKEIETLWSGVMTACGVLRFAPLKRSQKETLVPRPATCAFSLVGGSSSFSSAGAVGGQQQPAVATTPTDLDAPYKAYLEALAEGRSTETKTEAELRAERRRSSSVLVSVALFAAKRAKNSNSEAVGEGEQDEEDSDKRKATRIEGELLFKDRATLIETPRPTPQNNKSKNAPSSSDLIVLKSFIRTTSDVAGNNTPVSNASSPRSPRRTQDIPNTSNACSNNKNGHAIETESDQKLKKEGGGVGHSNTRTALEATLPKAFAGKSGAWLRRLYFPFVYHQMLLAGKEEEKDAHYDAWAEERNGGSLLAQSNRDRGASAFAESLRKSAFPSVDLQMSTRLPRTFSDDFISQTQANATVVPGREVQQYYSKATAASEVLNPLVPRGGLPRYIRPGLNDESLRLYLHQVKMNVNYDPLLAAAARNAGKLVYVPAPHNPGDTSQSSDSSEEKDLEAALVEQQHQSPQGQSQPSNASPFKSAQKTQKQQLRDHIRDQRGRTAILQDKDRFGIERAKVMEGKSTGRNSTRAIAHRMRLERKRGFRTSIETVFDFIDEMEVAEDLLREIGLTMTAEVTPEEAEEREQEELEAEVKQLVLLSQNNGGVADQTHDFGEVSFSAASNRLLLLPNVSKQMDSLYESSFSTFRHYSGFGTVGDHKHLEGETSKGNFATETNNAGPCAGSSGDPFLLSSLSPRLTRKSHFLPLQLTKEEEAAVIEQAKSNIKRKKRMEQDSLLHIIYHHNQQQQKITFGGGGASTSRGRPNNGHDNKRISGHHQKVPLMAATTDVSIDDVPQSKFRVSIWKDMNRKRRQKIVSDERERAGKEVFTERDEEGDLIDYKMDVKSRHKEQLLELCMEEISRRMTMNDEENNKGDLSFSSSGKAKRPSFSGDPTNLTAIERDIVFSRLPLNESTVPTYFAQPRKGIDAQLQQSSGGGALGASSSFFGMVGGGGGGNGGSSSAGGGGSGSTVNASLSIREMEELAQQFIRDEINDEIWHSYSEGRTNKVLAKRAAMEKLNDWLSQQMRLGRRLGVPNQIQAAEKLAKLQREVSSGPRQSPSAAAVHYASPSLSAGAVGKKGDNENSLTGEKLSSSRINSRRTSANSHILQTGTLTGGAPKGGAAAKSTLLLKEGEEGSKSLNFTDKRGSGEKSADHSTSRAAAIDDSSSVRSRSPTVIHNAHRHSPPLIIIGDDGNHRPGDKRAETSYITGMSFNTNNASRSSSGANPQVAVYPYITDPAGNTFVSAKEDLNFQKTLIAQNFTPARAPRANQQSVNRDRKTLSDKQFFAKLKASEAQNLLNSRKSPLSDSSEKDFGDADSNASLSAAKIMAAATPHPSILYQVSDEMRRNQTDLRALKAKAKEEEEESMAKEVTAGGLGIFSPPRDRRKFLGRGGRPPASASLLLTAPDTGNNDSFGNSKNSNNLIKMVGNRFGAVKKSEIPPRPSSATEMREVLERNKELLRFGVGSSQRENSGVNVGLAVCDLRKRPASAASANKNFGGGVESNVRPSSSSTVVIAGKVFTYDANFMTQSSNPHDGEEKGALLK